MQSQQAGYAVTCQEPGVVVCLLLAALACLMSLAFCYRFSVPTALGWQDECQWQYIKVTLVLCWA